MLRFKQFVLTEAPIDNSKYDLEKTIVGKDGKHAGHYAKYVEPHMGKSFDHPDDGGTPLELNKDVKIKNEDGTTTIHPKGTRVSPSDQHIKKGTMHHIEVETEHGHVTHVPVNAIKKPSTKNGVYNDEHAVATMWNYSVDHPKHGAHVARLHKEIDRAKDDPSHPLHISHAPSSSFTGGEKDSDAAKQTYYDRLKAVSHLVHVMVHGDSGKPHTGHLAKDHEEQSRMEVSGASIVPISKHFQKHGVRHGIAGTRKGDALMIRGRGNNNKSISLKHAGGSQLFSESPEGTKAMLHHAIDEHQKRHRGTDRELTRAEEKEHRRIIDDEIHPAMRDREDHKAAHEAFERLRNHPKYNNEGEANSIDHELGLEGQSGRRKFARPHRAANDERHPGVAHYTATVPLRQGKYSKNNPHGDTTFAPITRQAMGAKIQSGYHNRPSIESGKAGPTAKNNPSSMRMITPGRVKDFPKKETPKEGEY